MELEFLTVLLFCYKALAFAILFVVCVLALIVPPLLSADTDNPMWLLLYIISPLVFAVCYKVLWLL